MEKAMTRSIMTVVAVLLNSLVLDAGGLTAKAEVAQVQREVGGPIDPPAPPDEKPLDPRLQEQLLNFLPYVSMINRMTPGANQMPEIVRALEEWTMMRKEEENLFNGHPHLQGAYRSMRAFLLKSNRAAGPVLQGLAVPRMEFEADDPPFLILAALLFQASAEIAKNEALRSWYEQYDDQCRTAYKRVWPLLRKLAKGKRRNDDSVHVRHWFAREDWVFLEVLNKSHRPLTDVSLRLRLGTLDGATSDHYYFLKRWEPFRNDDGAAPGPLELAWNIERAEFPGRFPVRLATDWLSVGAAATTSVVIDLFSNEIVVESLMVAIDDHIPQAADRILDQAASQVRSRQQPKLVMDRLKATMSRLAQYPDRVARGERLFDLAKGQLDAAVASCDERIDKFEKQIKQLYDKRERRNADVPSINKRIVELKGKKQLVVKEKADILKGAR